MAQDAGDFLSALQAYRIALEILPQLAWLGLDIPSRQDWLLRTKAEDLGCLAATCTIRLGRFEEAIELLDLGRSILWQQSAVLRGDFQKLSETAPELARELQTVSQQLDVDNFHSESLTLGTADFIDDSLENSSRQRRDLVGTWEELVTKVRQLPEFGYFLRPVPFHKLCQSFSKGKVVIINVSDLGLDALIFNDAQPIQHVPILDIDRATLAELASDMSAKRPVVSTRDQRAQYVRRYMNPALRVVWEDIISPIFDAIQIPTTASETPPDRRIWWYLTGPLSFLPIHAAGPGRGVDVSQLVVSSYVTTLQSLYTASMQRLGEKSENHVKLLVIGQPETPGQDLCDLPSAKVEVEEVVEAVLKAGGSEETAMPLVGPDATVSRVSSSLESCTWVHFA